MPGIHCFAGRTCAWDTGSPLGGRELRGPNSFLHSRCGDWCARCGTHIDSHGLQAHNPEIAQGLTPSSRGSPGLEDTVVQRPGVSFQVRRGTPNGTGRVLEPKMENPEPQPWSLSARSLGDGNQTRKIVAVVRRDLLHLLQQFTADLVRSGEKP